METKNDTSGVFVLRQDLKPMEERHLEQDYPKHSKEGGDGISPRRTITVLTNKWRRGLFEGHGEGMEEDHPTLSLHTTGEPSRQISGRR